MVVGIMPFLNPEWVPSFFMYLTNSDTVFFFFLRNNNHNIVRSIHLLLSLSHPHSFVKCIIADVCKEESEVRKHTLQFLLKQNNFVIITKEKKISLKVPATVLRYCSNRKVDRRRRRRRRSPLRSSNSRSRVSRPSFSAASFNCAEKRELHETRSAEKTSRCSKRKHSFNADGQEQSPAEDRPSRDAMSERQREIEERGSSSLESFLSFCHPQTAPTALQLSLLSLLFFCPNPPLIIVVRFLSRVLTSWDFTLLCCCCCCFLCCK